MPEMWVQSRLQRVVNMKNFFKGIFDALMELIASLLYTGPR